ncbi:MAG: MotA/TolQ/ExbB proton channel family protein [Betaproteobacteria bacterium]|nr:MotA/TolQ/ExbB proton channel family protein [Betaproteobacteria bacterium]
MASELLVKFGPMAGPLLLCSVVALAICMERAVFCIKSQLNRQRQYEALSRRLAECRGCPKPIRDDVASVLLSELHRPYYRGIGSLRTIGSLSPLLGLLGTIIGIIKTFETISLLSGPIMPSMIAAGLWQAMLTTAAGLAIALPALALAHFFRQVSEGHLADFCHRLNLLSISFELDGNAMQPAQ